MRRTIRSIVIALAVAVSLLGSASVASAGSGKPHSANHHLAPIDITWE
jgi:uncharacterized protein YceK